MGRLGAPNREPHTECQTGAWAQQKWEKRADGGNELCENITREAWPNVTIDGFAEARWANKHNRQEMQPIFVVFRLSITMESGMMRIYLFEADEVIN